MSRWTGHGGDRRRERQVQEHRRIRFDVGWAVERATRGVASAQRMEDEIALAALHRVSEGEPHPLIVEDLELSIGERRARDGAAGCSRPLRSPLPTRTRARARTEWRKGRSPKL